MTPCVTCAISLAQQERQRASSLAMAQAALDSHTPGAGGAAQLVTLHQVLRSLPLRYLAIPFRGPFSSKLHSAATFLIFFYFFFLKGVREANADNPDPKPAPGRVPVHSLGTRTAGMSRSLSPQQYSQISGTQSLVFCLARAAD